MQFNTNADQQDIVSDITFLTGVDTNKFPLKDRARSTNEWNRKVWSWIFECYDGWLHIDDNISGVTGTGDVPFADFTITSGTGLYVIPTGALTIGGVEIKTTSGGTFSTLHPMTHEQFIVRGGDGAFSATGVPVFYMLQGDVVRLLPTPNFTLATALRIFFEEGISAILSTDTTKTPGFASPFHRILSIGASLDWSIARDNQKKIMSLTRLAEDYEMRIKKFYSKRYKERQPKRISNSEDLVDAYS